VSAEQFAHLSNLAIYSATVVYALALLVHIAEWASARDVHQAKDARVLIAAGAPGPSASLDASADSAARTGDPRPDRTDSFGQIAMSLTVLAFGMHLIGVVSRGLAADRVPWGNMYEFSTTGALAVTGAFLALSWRYQLSWLGLLVTAFTTTVLGVAVLTLYVPAGPLVPALHSYWLVIHVAAAAIAGGAYTVGAMASVLYLVKSRWHGGYLDRLPSKEDIDRLAYRVHAFAFPTWTFAVLCGAIWAEYAWGRYWGWDPKEVWALITWVVYAAYLHARATAGWQGKAAAYIALVGFGTFLFNFVGINLWGSGLHSYAGV
jgi:cytochrome c-type biogenesis protein CcsB